MSHTPKIIDDPYTKNNTRYKNIIFLSQKQYNILKNMMTESKADTYLLNKYKKDKEFKSEVQRSYENYRVMSQTSYYTDLSVIDEGLFIRIDHPEMNVYFYFGCLHPQGQDLLHKLTLFFVRNFNREPKAPYVFVFFNYHAPSDAFSQLQNIFQLLTLDHFLYLHQLIVIRPSFYQKAVNFFTFNTLPKYLKSKTTYMSSAAEFCVKYSINPKHIIQLLPKIIKQKEFPKIRSKEANLVNYRINLEGQKKNMSQIQIDNKFEESIKSFLLVKPGKETHYIENYEMGKHGIPMVLEILIYYFKTKPKGLLLEGLFRKSVSIDEENELLAQISNKNYDSLLEVGNPHIIANLIKRFFSNLKIPIIPFNLFQELMHDQGVQDKILHIRTIMQKLPETNYLTLLTLLRFLNKNVIPYSDQNKMTAKNLAICFSPCLLRSQKPSEADLIYASKGAIITQQLLTNIDIIFGNEQQQVQLFRISETKHHLSFQDGIGSKLSSEKEAHKQELQMKQQEIMQEIIKPLINNNI